MTRYARGLAVVLAICASVGTATAATVTLLDAGTAETQDVSMWNSPNGATCVTSTAVTRNNGRSMRGTSAGGGRCLPTSGHTTTAASRVSLFIYRDGAGATAMQAARVVVAGDVTTSITAFFLTFDASGHLVLDSTGTGGKTGTAVLTYQHWYRYVLAWTLTSTSNYTIKAFVYDTDGTTLLDSLTMTNADQTLFAGDASATWTQDDGSGFATYVSDVYADDGNTLDNPGNINVTFKQPASNSTNNFDTAIGANPANRWTNVNELPLSTTNGWQQAGASQVAEVYGLQANNSTTNTSQDVSGATIVGWAGWASAAGDNIATTLLSTAAAATTTGTAANGAGSCVGKATGTTCATASFSVVAGDLCIAALADQMASTAPTIASSPASTWSALSGPTTSTVRLSAWYSPMTSSGSTTVTFTFPSSALSRAGAVVCFPKGATAATPLDVNATNTADGTSTYTGPATGTLAQANEWVVGIFAFAGLSTDNVAVAGGFTRAAGGNGTGIGTTGGTAAANSAIFIEYLTVSATTTQTPTATDATSNRAGVQKTATFKRSGATAGTPQLVVNGVDNAVTLNTPSNSPTTVTAYTTSASYPSGTFGMKSTGTDADTYFYEGGVKVAYVPGAGGTVVPNFLSLLGVGPGQ